MKLRIGFVNIKNKLICPFTGAFIQASILYIIYIYAIQYNFYYKAHQLQSRLPELINEEISKCQKNHWFSWIAINQLKNKYEFIYVGNCKEDKINCSVNVRNEDSFFLKEHSVLEEEFLALRQFNSGDVVFYPDLSDLDKDSSIYKATRASKYKINKLGLVVTKKFKDNIIYLFVFSKNSLGKCSDANMINSLKKISNYVEERI